DGRAPPRGRDLVLHDGGAPPAGPGAGAAAQGRARQSSLARMGRGHGRLAANAGRPEPVEPGQGPVLGAATHRARVRGEVRPPAGGPLPPRHHLPALAPRQAPGGLPLRSARGDAARRAGADLRSAALRRAVLALVGAIACAALVVVVRAWRFRPQPRPAAAPAAAAVDPATAAEHLAAAIRFRTISRGEGAAVEAEAFDALRAWLEATYPVAHRVLDREVVAG